MSEVLSKKSAFEALFASLTGENAALPGVVMAAFREDGNYPFSPSKSNCNE